MFLAGIGAKYVTRDEAGRVTRFGTGYRSKKDSWMLGITNWISK